MCKDMIKEKSTAFISCDRIGQKDCPASHELSMEVNTAPETSLSGGM